MPKHIIDTGNQSLSGGLTLTGELSALGYIEGQNSIGNSGATQTIALSTGTIQTCTLDSNCEFTMPPADVGRSFLLFLNTGAGSLSATFTGVKWPSNVAPTITVTASRMDIISFVSDSTNWYGSIVQNYTP